MCSVLIKMSIFEALTTERDISPKTEGTFKVLMLHFEYRKM